MTRITMSTLARFGFGILMLLLMAVAGHAQTRAPDCGSFTRGKTYRCHCDVGRPLGPAWGSGPYTGDSDVCTAALHAGVVGPGGGTVTAYPAPGEPSYSGSLANGVQTDGWGPYDYSFAFASGDVMNPENSAAALAKCKGFPGNSDFVACTCPPAAGATGPVWGSGPYTANSDLCSAARHDGVIGPDGGKIAAVVAPGLDHYTGSEENEIISKDFGPYERSFVLDHNAK